MSFKPEVSTDGGETFHQNALCFATFAEARANARDLMGRWMLVTDYRAVESGDPVLHTYVDGVLDYVAKETQ